MWQLGQIKEYFACELLLPDMGRVFCYLLKFPDGLLMFYFLLYVVSL